MIAGVPTETLGTIELFVALDDSQQRALTAECEWLLVRAGALVARAGEEWGALFVVVSGQVRLVDERIKPVAVTIDVLSGGSAFGESTLFDKAAGGFSAYCQADAVLLKLDRAGLRRAIAGNPELGGILQDYQKQRAVRTFLRATTVFGTLSPRQMQLLLRSLEKRHAAGGDVILREGDEADGLYIVEKGALRVYRDANPSHVVASLASGAVVGEIGLLSDDKRNASVMADTVSALWFLPKAAFRELLESNAALAGSFATLLRERTGAAPREEEIAKIEAAAAETTGSAATQRAPKDTPELFPRPNALWIEIGVASLLSQLLYLLLPIFAKFVLDDVIAMRDDRLLSAVAGGMGVVALISLVAAFIQLYLSQYSAQRTEQVLLQKIWRHALQLPMRFFDRRPPGEIAVRLADAGVLSRFYSQASLGFSTSVVAALLYLALMMHYSRSLAGVALLLAAINGILLWVEIRRERDVDAATDWGEQRDDRLRNSLARLQSIRLLGAEVFVRWEFEDLVVRAANAARRLIDRALRAEGASRFFSLASATAILFYGAWMVLQGTLTAGELVACIILAPGLTAPLRAAPRFVEAWRDMKRASERLRNVLSESTEPDGVIESAPAIPTPASEIPAPRRGEIRFEDVWFRYSNQGPFVLRDVRCEIQPGQRVAFMGRSGSGKSTMMKLLLGLYEPVSGRITLDGEDIRTLDRQALRRRMGVVLQQAFLFHDTVRGNISRGMPGAPLNDIVIAAQRAGAHDFISAMPQGYETMIGEQGANLSGGQKQRIMIAQAFLRDPEILILDEATSALDQEADRFLLYTLDHTFQDRTTMLVSPRQRAANSADLILVLDNGRIVERGTHAQLLEQGGIYRAMMSQQE